MSVSCSNGNWTLCILSWRKSINHDLTEKHDGREREGGREREKKIEREIVCVCVREIERERE